MSHGFPVLPSHWTCLLESPPTPKMDLNPKDIREGWTSVTCSVPYHCPAEPLRLTISGLGNTRLSSQQTTTRNGMIQTVVDLEMTWEDHGKSLVCSLEEQNGLEISKSTMQLYVKYAPKDVRVIASPGVTIREGETLSLECTRSSSNPEVYEYLWYKDDQLMFEWLKLKKIEFETEGDQHSGIYRCEAKNSVGSEKSEELRIDVQSHLHYSSAPPTSGCEPASGCQPTTESRPQSSPAPPSTTKSILPCDGRTLWKEFSFLSEPPNQAGKPRTQFIHSCKELTSAVIHLTEQFRKALLQIRQRIRLVPNEIKKQ